jgi:hypothetical protein
VRPPASHREFRDAGSGRTRVRRIRGRSGGVYEIVRDLPAGGMAEAFVAVRRGLGDFAFPCCIKRMLGTEREEFLQEARILGNLAHDRIVRAFEVDEDEDGVCFIAMELVDGVNLGELLTHYDRSCRRMSPSLCVYVASEVLEALDYAYNRVVDGEPLHTVHRDVTPSNILLGRDGYVKLADFGIAKFKARPNFTRTGMAKGKGPYMSPEHYDKRRGLDHRSDLFSLGATLYEMLSGERAFHSDSEQETLYAVLHGEFTPLAELVPAVDPALAELVQHLLAPDKDRRPRDAEEVRERLRAFEPHGSPRSALAQEVEACMERESRAEQGLGEPITGHAQGALQVRDTLADLNAPEGGKGSEGGGRPDPEQGTSDEEGDSGAEEVQGGSAPAVPVPPPVPPVSAGAGISGWLSGRRRMALLGGLAALLALVAMAPFVGSRREPARPQAPARSTPAGSTREATPATGAQRHVSPLMQEPSTSSDRPDGGLSVFAGSPSIDAGEQLAAEGHRSEKAAEEAPRHGSLRIKIRAPRGFAWVDGRCRGRAPVLVEDLPAGRHEVGASTDEKTPPARSKRVEVVGGRESLVELVLFDPFT